MIFWEFRIERRKMEQTEVNVCSETVESENWVCYTDTDAIFLQ